MFCSQCGTEAQSDDQFCRSCGRPLATTPVQPASEPASPAPAGAGQPGPTWSGQVAQAAPARGGVGVGAATPLDIETLAEFASIGRRIGAFTIDVVLAMLVLLAVSLVVVLSQEAFTGVPNDALTEAEEEIMGVWILGVWGALLFFSTLTLNTTGATLGKRILGLTIVRDDLQTPGFAVGLGRTLAAWLSWIPLGLGFLWATWDERSQTWHDKMASTYAVRTDSLPRPERGPVGNPRLQ